MSEVGYKLDPLWQAIEAFALDEMNTSLPFSKRLARENGWTHKFALTVIHEYRRFCYIACRCGKPVTPSEEVDQAWHLHLLYSRNYWDEFCATVLKRPFHHGPTQGGPAEQEKYRDWYQNTLDSYVEIFGEHPPRKIWPLPVNRFRWVDYFERVNCATHWVIPKPFLFYPLKRKRKRRD